VPIPLPHLDDRTYADLLDEARALLPALAPAWTHHNPSDPGITLLELFAWLAEMQVWRTGQIPDTHVRAFLRLLNGGGGTGGELDEEVHAAVAGVRDGYRAVTPADFERLATDGFNALLAAARAAEAVGGALPEWQAAAGPAGEAPSRVAFVARARCVPRRYLAAGDEAARTADAPGQVSVIVVPRRQDDPAAPDPPPPPLSAAPPPLAGEATRRAVWGFLEERRLLATRVHVVDPLYVPVRVEAVVVRRADAPDPAPPAALADGWDGVAATDVRRGVLEAVAAWLDPLRGGPGGRGWPFGRDVHVSDLYGVLDAVHGLDHVADLRLSSPCTPDDAACVAAVEVRHPESGEQVGLALAAHHLPHAVLRAEDVRVAHTVVPVRVLVSLTPAPGVAGGALERAVEDAVRAAFGPLAGGPGGEAAADVRAAVLRAALRALPQVDERHFVHVRFEADPAHLPPAADADSHVARFAAGEIAAARLAPLLTDGTRLW
jgi:hypothetical protein